MAVDDGFFVDLSHMRSYSLLARTVQPGQDRKMIAALFVLSMLPKQGVIRQKVSTGKIDFDSIAGALKDRDLIFFARDIAKVSGPGDPKLYVNRLKEKYQGGALRAIQFFRGDIPMDVIKENVVTIDMGKGGEKMLEQLIEVANRDFDGHFSLLKFTTNWRCCFGTVSEYWHIPQMASGKTMEEAIERCLESKVNVLDFEDED